MEKCLILLHFHRECSVELYKTEKFPVWKSLKYFNIFLIKKNYVRFEYVLSSSV